MFNQSLTNTVRDLYTKLEKLYPIEAMYNSRATLFSCGLKDNVITEEEYNLAEQYYGHIWDYVGD